MIVVQENTQRSSDVVALLGALYYITILRYVYSPQTVDT